MKMMKVKTPSNIYLWWNIGSSIMMMMAIQMITGIMLSMNYINKQNMFDSSTNIYFNVNYGWITRLMHSNMTSMIFIMMFMHMARGILFKSFLMTKMWMTGMMMMLMTMLESFIGYSLIWNQMSYWAMMVITNFISAIPKLGNKMIKIIWGNFNINIILINRFLSIHFLIPMLIMMMSMLHMMVLHKYKSNNPMGLMKKSDMISLSPIFIIKDMVLIMSMFTMMMWVNNFNPFLFSNSDNFVSMNYFKTPSHIEPEWYFLFFYSILRSINNKLSGLLIMMMSIIMLLIMPILNKNKFQNFNSMYKLDVTMLVMTMINMSILSTKPVEYPYKEMNMMLIITFFMTFMKMSMTNKFINKI